MSESSVGSFLSIHTFGITGGCVCVLETVSSFVAEHQAMIGLRAVYGSQDECVDVSVAVR
jgi:hypothetical protein